MAVSESRFLARWPHFNEVAMDTLSEALAAARLRVNEGIYGDKTDEAVMQLTAHLICIDPAGQFARLVSKEGTTTYMKEVERMRCEVVFGDRVI